MLFRLIISCIISSQTVFAEAAQERLKLTDPITKIPSTFVRAFDEATKKEQVPKWIAVGVLTAGTITYDQEITDSVQHFGEKNGLSTKDKTKTYFHVGSLAARGPSDLISGLYFLGDGWIHIGTATAFLGTGWIGDHTRAFNMGIQLFHGLTVSTIMSQAIKRSTGREGPFRATAPGAAWRPFPSVASYEGNKTKFDAFPSGHVMVATVTFNLIRWNYPEYQSILYPTQIVYTSLLGFAMVMNGIHWTGDYPLGIALGYFFSKASFLMGKKTEAEPAKATAFWAPEFSPEWHQSGVLLPTLKWAF